MTKQLKTVKLNDIVPYENNPRHNDQAVDAVKESIKQCEYIAPIIVDEDMVILAGHTRHKALKSLGKKEAEVMVVTGLTEEQKRKYRLLDNKTNEFSEWDADLLEVELDDLDFDGYDFDFDIPDDESQVTEHTKLTDRFVVPPFSILDTRQGYWQDRKREWLSAGIRSNEGRSQNLMLATDTINYAYMNTSMKGVAPQTSVFDPVLCEIAYKWFCTEGGYIYDPFAGGSVRGIVADKLGYLYTGIDLRQEQVDANRANAVECDVNPTWICDDSLNADTYLKDETMDLIFTCPPYYDLEVYSDDPRDISNMEYEDFCETYKQIIEISCRKLKQDRFAVFVVGDIRDRKGAYRNFVDFTKKCFLQCGLITYNELVLVEQSGTGAIRAPQQFGKNRKVVKTHQNVLVMYKGDPKKIKGNFATIEVSTDE